MTSPTFQRTLASLLISLDLSAAFDAIDHSTLLNRLYTSFGFTQTALSWLESYLTGRYQLVCIGRHSSKPAPCPDVPQRSVLGPLLFTIYTSPVSSIAQSYNIQQMILNSSLLCLLLAFYLTCTTSQCLSALHSWFCFNGMALNPDKSDAIIGTRQRSRSYSALTSVDVAGSTIPLADHIKILGVTLDKHLTSTTTSVQSATRHTITSGRCATFSLPSLKTWRSLSPAHSLGQGSTMPTLLCMACHRATSPVFNVWRTPLPD